MTFFAKSSFFSKAVIGFVLLGFSLVSCKTGVTKKDGKEIGHEITGGFSREELMASPFFTVAESPELFRVYLGSDFYLIKQFGSSEYLSKKEDPGGDQMVREALIKLNKLDEEREGIVKVMLYPKAGTISKIRPMKLTFLEELDRVMVEDLQRWQFDFHKRYVWPTTFLIRYRFKLKKEFAAKEKTLDELEQEYLEKNPQFYKYLMREKKKKELEKLKTQN